ncbi:hypothetical protein [Sporosarcina cyprini]|uniref:hypothetical protein n=1 Tax=Sporosarcina cyprini TaxID=2910523 RepID=UPI001EDEFC85|nr:hypothetical protein [Sporosarcina cyprini]MCG3087525.1 hypothetical protein [Sporosarcina cyprini]
MKKLVTSMLCILLLAACSTNDSKKETETSKNPAVESSSDSDTTNEANSDAAEDAAADNETSSTDNELASYDEYETIASTIDLDTNKGIVETDNKGNRVILFEDANGNKTYKSIFTKHDRFLKIIDLSTDQLLFKDRLN